MWTLYLKGELKSNGRVRVFILELKQKLESSSQNPNHGRGNYNGKWIEGMKGVLIRECRV